MFSKSEVIKIFMTGSSAAGVALPFAFEVLRILFGDSFGLLLTPLDGELLSEKDWGWVEYDRCRALARACLASSAYSSSVSLSPSLSESAMLMGLELGGDSDSIRIVFGGLLVFGLTGDLL